MRNPFLRFLTSHACTFDHWELDIRPPHEWCGGVIKLLFFIGQLVKWGTNTIHTHVWKRLDHIFKFYQIFIASTNLDIPYDFWCWGHLGSLPSTHFFWSACLHAKADFIMKPREHECHHSTKFEKIQQFQSWSYVVGAAIAVLASSKFGQWDGCGPWFNIHTCTKLEKHIHARIWICKFGIHMSLLEASKFIDWWMGGSHIELEWFLWRIFALGRCPNC